MLLSRVDVEPGADAGLAQQRCVVVAHGNGQDSSLVPWCISTGSVIRSKYVRDDSSR